MFENDTQTDSSPTNSIYEGIKVDNDGILRFQNSEIFNNFITNFVKLDDNQKDEWERNLNFVSYRSHFRKFNQQLDEANEEKNDFERIKNDNSKYFKIENDYIEPIIPVELYQSIVSKDGYFYVDTILHKVIEDKIYLGTNFNNIKMNEGFQYIDSNQNKGYRIDYKEVSIDKDKRSLRATMWSYSVLTFLSWPFDINNATQRQVVEVQTRAFKKYLGDWHLYGTDHYNQNIRFSVVVPKRVYPPLADPNIQFFYNFLHSFERLSTQGHPDCQVWTDTYLVGDVVDMRIAKHAYGYGDFYYDSYAAAGGVYRIPDPNRYFRYTLSGSFSSGGVAPYWSHINEQCSW